MTRDGLDGAVPKTLVTENKFQPKRGALRQQRDTHQRSSGDADRESILIVEDSPLSAKLAKALFASEGFEVRTASSARRALAVLRRFRPDVVLTDLRMPDMDGFELARRIKADLSSRSVVLATSAEREVDEDGIRRAGCDGFVPKPIEVGSVRAKTAEFRASRGSLRQVVDPGTRAADPCAEWDVTDSIRRATRKLGMDGSDPWLHRFLSRSAADLHALRRAAADEDTPQLGMIAHGLAGLCGMLGAVRVARLCMDLARRADSGSPDHVTAVDLDRLEMELEAVRVAIGELEAEAVAARSNGVPR